MARANVRLRRRADGCPASNACSDRGLLVAAKHDQTQVGHAEPMNDGPSDPGASKPPPPARVSRGIASLLVGLISFPSDFARRYPAQRRPAPPRSEVRLAICSTGAGLVIGGVIGWWVFSNLAGVFLGLLCGLFAAIIPIALGCALLRRFKQNSQPFDKPE
jgi:hypothetical protein